MGLGVTALNYVFLFIMLVLMCVNMNDFKSYRCKDPLESGYDLRGSGSRDNAVDVIRSSTNVNIEFYFTIIGLLACCGSVRFLGGRAVGKGDVGVLNTVFSACFLVAACIILFNCSGEYINLIETCKDVGQEVNFDDRVSRNKSFRVLSIIVIVLVFIAFALLARTKA